MIKVANNPFDAAIALAKMKGDEPDLRQIVGSGFVVAAEGAPRNSAIIVTAAHVADHEYGSDLAAIGRPQSRAAYGWQVVRSWHLRRDLDLAVGLIEWESDLVGLRVQTGPSPRNQDVECIEFSRALVQDEHGDPVLAPLYRKGHIIQSAHGVRPRFESLRMLELSFPAFSGSSGAPVLGEQSRTVVGAIVANLHRELSPSQISTTYDEDGRMVEEYRYHTPNGLAVGAEHIADALASGLVALG